MTTATPPIASTPTNTTRPKTKKTHTPLTDRQVNPIISNNNTNMKKKKKKQQQAKPLKTSNPPKMLAEAMIHVLSNIAKLTDEDTAEYIAETVLKNPFDDDTREFVPGILKEAMPYRRAGVVLCDRLFVLVYAIEKQRKKKQQKQNNMITATKIRPTSTPNRNTKTTHTQLKDQQLPVISINNTNKKKEKQEKAIPPKTRTHEEKVEDVPPTNTKFDQKRQQTRRSHHQKIDR